MPIQRYKLTIAYRGTRYHGWQRQPAQRTWKGPQPPKGQGLPTISESLSRAISTVITHPFTLIGSSRTDAGVHAKGQVAHFDTDLTQIPPEKMQRAINHQLPGDILVRGLEPAPAGFDAIGSTISKRYQYFVWNAPERPVFFADMCFHRWQKLDRDAMADAARRLIGEHDFTSFAKPGHGRESTVRTVFDCEVTWRGPKVIIGVEGSGFLWNMVRIIAGTLIEVGIGHYRPEEIDAMLAAKNRRAAGRTAPAHGLYLQWIRSAPGDDANAQPT